MGSRTSIEWTESTWNPVTGCTKVSQGCKHCYAERLAYRLQAMGNPRYVNGFQVTLHHDLIGLPLQWRRPRIIFVNSMSDLFHESVPDSFIKAVFSTMEAARWHIFQILTKRTERLERLAPQLPWPSNIWMGVTVERQDYVWRLDHLRRVPAAVRFVSCEPLLGLLDVDLAGLHWVVVGGESGPAARPLGLNWARYLRDLCRAAGVAFFLKQLGGEFDKRGGHRAKLDGRLWREMPNARLAEDYLIPSCQPRSP